MSNAESFIKYTNLMQMLATLKISYEEISNACEISTEMFLQKLNGEASFTLHEAQTIKMFINSKINIDYLFKE